MHDELRPAGRRGAVSHTGTYLVKGLDNEVARQADAAAAVAAMGGVLREFGCALNRSEGLDIHGMIRTSHTRCSVGPELDLSAAYRGFRVAPCTYEAYAHLEAGDACFLGRDCA